MDSAEILHHGITDLKSQTTRKEIMRALSFLHSCWLWTKISKSENVYLELRDIIWRVNSEI